MTNIKKKLVNDDPNIREAKITKLKKKKKNQTSLSSYFSWEVKLGIQVIFLKELNGESNVYISLAWWSLYNTYSCIVWAIFQTL